MSAALLPADPAAGQPVEDNWELPSRASAVSDSLNEESPPLADGWLTPPSLYVARRLPNLPFADQEEDVLSWSPPYTASWLEGLYSPPLSFTKANSPYVAQAAEGGRGLDTEPALSAMQPNEQSQPPDLVGAEPPLLGLGGSWAAPAKALELPTVRWLDTTDPAAPQPLDGQAPQSIAQPRDTPPATGEAKKRVKKKANKVWEDNKGNWRCAVPGCGKAYTSRSGCYSHVAVEHEEARYSCAYCDKEFTRKSFWQDHLNTHSGEKPYTCDICQKEFCTRTSRRDHAKSHSQAILKCDRCGNDYARHDCLRRHLKSCRW